MVEFFYTRKAVEILMSSEKKSNESAIVFAFAFNGVQEIRNLAAVRKARSNENPYAPVTICICAFFVSARNTSSCYPWKGYRVILVEWLNQPSAPFG